MIKFSKSANRIAAMILIFVAGVLMALACRTNECYVFAAAKPVTDKEVTVSRKNAAPSYQKLYPDFYAPAKPVVQTPDDKTVYLTFDDGPSKQTARLLDILDKENVKATFFVVGLGGNSSLPLIRRAAQSGHTVGMHSNTHNYKYIYGSVENYLADMHKIFVTIKETTGITPTVFRFPGGSVSNVNGKVRDAVMAEMLRRGFVPYDWSVEASDAVKHSLSADKIVSNVVSHVPNSRRPIIVLMHDSQPRKTTVDAVGPIIKQLKNRGYRFDKLTPSVKPVLFRVPSAKQQRKKKTEG